MANIRSRVKQARKEAGYHSQREFAPLIGVTRETLGKYESKEESITLDVVRNVAAVTNKPLAWFFLEDGYDLIQTTTPRVSRAPLERALEKASGLQADLLELQDALSE